MRYSIFIKDADQPEAFLQSSEYLERIKTNKSTINRWMTEMSIYPKDHTKAQLIIYEDANPIFTKPLGGIGANTWKKL
jgi:hypothetical protein